MAKDIIGQYAEPFKATKLGSELNTKLSVILGKMEENRKAEKAERIAEVAKAMERRRNGEISESEESELISKATVSVMNKYANESRKLFAEQVSVQTEIENAIKAYAQKIESNDAWNRIHTLKVTPKILNALSKKGTTEYNLELEIYGEVRTKQNRIDFELFRMETLGWIDRKGSGTVGDAMICNLTDEGKRQLDYYNKHKMFDCSKVA